MFPTTANPCGHDPATQQVLHVHVHLHCVCKNIMAVLAKVGMLSKKLPRIIA